MSEAASDKAGLRTYWRKVRRGLAADGAVAAEQLAQHIDALPLPDRRDLTVAAYLAAGSELDPAPLIAALRNLGIRIALPVVVDLQGPLAFRLAEPDTAWVPDLMGIPAPPPSAPAIRPHLVLVPLLAFDDHGGRLGQGGGFYDRTLAALRAEGTVLGIGLAFTGQRADALALEPHDQRLDGVLTEDGYRAALQQM